MPANDSHVHVNLFPQNNASMPGQYNYVEHTRFDSAGNAGSTVFGPSVSLPPDGSTAGRNISNAADFPATLAADANSHSRAGGARYGAAGAGAFTAVNSFANDGQLTLNEAGEIVTASAVGGTAAAASDVLGNRIGAVRGGAVVDGAIAVGTSVWHNADAVEAGTMSAGDATADVIVDTGVAVSAGLTGMAAGAAVGSVVPIAGTAVGAGVGFVVGAGGAWVASKTLEDVTGAADWARDELGDFLEDNFEEPLDAAWNAVDDARDYAVEAVSETVDDIGETLSDFGNDIADTASDAAEAVGDAIEDTYTDTRDALGDAGRSVSNFVGGLFGR